MKKSKKVPRRVASSLVQSLHLIASRLRTAIGYCDSPHHYIEKSVNETNKKHLRAADTSIVESVCEFYEGIQEKVRRGRLADDAFVTIAKHKELRVRYVAHDTSLGLVITTGCLQRLLDLAANVADQVEYVDNKTQKAQYVCETTNRWSNASAAPHFLRVLDILRYMEETDVEMLEISLKGIENDMDALNNVGNHYGRQADAQAIRRLYPFMSDRYQEDSWRHYLTTLYSGMVDHIDLFTPSTHMSRDIALSELNIVKA